MYFTKDELNGEISSINKMIKIEDILSVDYVDYTEDYLNGYNFYVQTTDKLYIMSFKSARDTVKWVNSLNKLLIHAPKIIDKCAKQGFKYPTRLLKSLEDFNPKRFLEQNMFIFKLKFYRLNESFDVEDFKFSFQNLKKFLKVLKYNEELNSKVQPFLIEFHKLVCKSLSNTRFEFSSEEMPEIYRVIRNYTYLLEKYNVNDLQLKKYLVKFNNVLFERLIDSILDKLKGVVMGYLEDTKESKSQKDFYEYIFASVAVFNKEDPKLKIGYEACQKIITKVNTAIIQKIIFDQDVNMNQLILLFKSCLKFNSSFFEFVESNLGKCLDNKFVDELKTHTLPTSVNNLLGITLNEIENRLEIDAQYFFKSKKKFPDLNLNDLFNDQFRETVNRLKGDLPDTYSEIILNNYLNFVLACYFSRSFILIGESEFDHGLIEKLKKDSKLVYSTFILLIEKDNLEVLVGSFNYLVTLLTGIKYEDLLKSLINFDLFFGNKLTTDILVAILGKNIDISIDVEEELINYFNHCIFITNQRNQLAIEKSVNESKSQILFNSQKTQRKISNYLPSIPMNLSDKVRTIVFNQRARALKRKKDDSIDLSTDFGLVHVSVTENFLENTVKLILSEQSLSFNEAEFKEAVKVV